MAKRGAVVKARSYDDLTLEERVERGRMLYDKQIKGATVGDLAESFKVSITDVNRLIADYTGTMPKLDEHAQYVLAIDRLNMLLDRFWKQVDEAGLSAKDNDFSSNLRAGLDLVKEISDLAGLKKKRIAFEVEIIEESQRNLVERVMLAALNDVLVKVVGLLDDETQQVVEANKHAWLAEAIRARGAELEEKVEIPAE